MMICDETKTYEYFSFFLLMACPQTAETTVKKRLVVVFDAALKQWWPKDFQPILEGEFCCFLVIPGFLLVQEPPVATS